MKIDTLDRVAEDVVQGVRLAAKAILTIYDNQPLTNLTIKPDKSPLTQADLLSHQILNQYLKDRFALPVLSEEGKDELARLKQDWVWLVDPLDGTKEFLNRNGEFTINVALVYKNRPVLGIIAVPTRDEIYVGVHGQGAYLLERTKKIMLCCSSVNQLSDASLSVSRSHLHPALKKTLQQHKITRFIPQGSALKYCSIAQGITDASIRKTPLMEWDLCAADCILFESGAILTDFMGKPLIYNNRSPLVNKGIVASNQALHSALVELAKSLIE